MCSFCATALGAAAVMDFCESFSSQVVVLLEPHQVAGQYSEINDTSALKTPNSCPKLVISIQLELCNQGISK
jgi:hypothetical protein